MVNNEFIKEAREIHGNKYDYSKVDYKNMRTKVCIICPIHGEFWQTPEKHIRRKHGCPKCGHSKRAESRLSNSDEFIAKANKIHHYGYDYSKTVYENAKTKVCIICPTHGEFWMTPNKHLLGQGCPQCKGAKISQKLSSTTDEFIMKATQMHGGKYDYSKVEYKNNHEKVRIVCPEHGEFWQTPQNHLGGKGCPICNTIYNGAEVALFEELKRVFKQEEIIYQYHNKELLGMMSFDIYMPKYKIAIEYQGDQHFSPNKVYGEERFQKQVERDKRKFEICQTNSISILYANFKKSSKIPSNYLSTIYRTTEDVVNKVKELILNN